MDSRIAEGRRPTRNSNMELLRILSMLLIVAHHYAYHSPFSLPADRVTLSQAWWCVLMPGGGIGVDVFVMISGYYLIQNTDFRLSLRKISKLWGQVFIYSVVLYALSLVLRKEKVYQYGVFGALFPLSTSQWWFASNYFILYLLHPYLNRLLRLLEKAQYQKLLLIMLFIWVVIPNITLMQVQTGEIVFFIVLYAAAGYIRLYGFGTPAKSRTWMCLGLAAFLAECLLLIVLTAFGMKDDFLRNAAISIVNKQSAFSVFIAVCLLMFFSALPVRNDRTVNIVSSAMFGVYLLHDSNLLRPILWEELFVNLPVPYTAEFIPYSLLVTAVVFLACTFVELARQRLLEAPFLRWVDVNAEKITKAFQTADSWVRERIFVRKP